LHIGGARTALFNWLFARSAGGKFLVRIEDTDKERSTSEYLESVLQSLEWLGLKWDEELYIQSRALEKHHRAAYELLKRGAAYRCFCTPDVLEQKRKEAEEKRRIYRYDGTCRNLPPEEVESLCRQGKPFAIRCRVPDGETVFNDLIHGRTVFKNAEIDDFIILRSDQTPIYQLAVVVDDHEMGITYVIRGDDHLSNTPKQIILYRALGWELPQFGHMPMIFGPDKTRLSKRHGAVSVESYRERGYLPEALKNYLLLLGWSPPGGKGEISLEEAVSEFRIEDSLKKSAVFDEQKLQWMNGQYISALSEEELAARLEPFIAVDKELAAAIAECGSGYLYSVLSLIKLRMKLLTDFILYGGYFYRDPIVYDPEAVKKHWLEKDTVIERLARLRLRIIDENELTIESSERAVRGEAEKMGIPAAQLIHPTRLALTGYSISPGLFEVMALLGRETIIRRLDSAVAYISTL
jgi:glutamyl-tRNA synthetase